MPVCTALQILLVEDDSGMALLAADRLGEVAGWTVTTALSAADCRARVAEHRFDVILLDRGLPDCDGATLISELLARQPDAAVVMLTGADSAESATETLKRGAWDYVVKRPDLEYLDELPAVIQRCAERLAWRREEARLRDEVDLLLAAMRTAADAMIVTDGHGRVRFWNAAAERLFGWRADEVRDAPLPLIPADRAAEFAELGERARRGTPLVGVETTVQRRDGSRVDVSLTFTAVCGADGSVRAYAGVLRDISERKQLEQARADFAAMLTHDIKNPLVAIEGSASVLAEAELTPECAEWVAAIEQSAETINTLLNDFLISATLDAGKVELARERVPVASLVHSCLRQFRASAARKQVHLRQDGDVSATFVIGDHVQLERALGNLVANAIKYTPVGGRVLVGATYANDTVQLRVRDTGPGISAEDLPRVFDKYRRVKGTERIDGAGLGLYIVRSLVEAHGGSVSASSQLGHGSVFTITLPLALADAA